jgi:hypothetical protein
MEASPTTVNPIQMQLLRMFSYEKDEHNLKEIQKLLFDYYCNKVEEDILTIDEFRNKSVF